MFDWVTCHRVGRMRILPLAAAAAIALAATPAAADAQTKPLGFHYKIVSAVHTSSVSETTDHYSGTSSESWQLRGPSNGFPNSGDFGTRHGLGNAIFLFNVRGTYNASVTVPEEDVYPGDPNHCEATVSTGDTSDNAAMAPDAAQLVLVYNKRYKRVDGHWRFPMAMLNPPIFGANCSGANTVFPEDSAFRTHYPLSLFLKKRFTLSDTGGPGGKYGNYTWSTKITVTRNKLPR